MNNSGYKYELRIYRQFGDTPEIVSFYGMATAENYVKTLCSTLRSKIRAEHGIMDYDRPLIGDKRTGIELADMASYKLQRYSIYRLCDLLSLADKEERLLGFYKL